MENLQLTQMPVAKAEMLIRRPVAEVFEAFINPTMTTKFWFTRSSGRLEAGKQVQWDWEMYDVSSQVSVKAIEENKRILIACLSLHKNCGAPASSHNKEACICT